MDTDDFVHQERRPSKRRKFYRKRADSPQSDGATTTQPDISSSTPNPLSTNDGLSVPSIERAHDTDKGGDPSQLPVIEILRRRRAAQRKRAGIEFGKATSLAGSSATEVTFGNEIIGKDDSLEKILTVVDRFAPQTGQVADVDKHMYAKLGWHLFQRCGC